MAKDVPPATVASAGIKATLTGTFSPGSPKHQYAAPNPLGRDPDIAEGPLKENDRIKMPINGAPIIHIGMNGPVMVSSEIV